MIKEYSIIEGKVIESKNKQDLSWIELINPNEEEVKKVTEAYNLPNDYISDVDDPYELPRTEGLEDEAPNLFILNYPIQINNRDFITRAVSMIVADKIMITVRNDNSKVFDDLKASKKLKRKNIGSIETFLIEATWIISKIFIEYVKILNEEIKDLENRLKASTKTELLYDMIKIQKSLINFDAAIRENSPVIESIFKIESENTDDELRLSLLNDLLKENRQATVMIEKSSDFLEKLSDLYSNVISNNMNTVMKVLTSASIVMTVPTIIGGLWGMNTNLPLANHPNAFWYLILLSVTISILIIYYLKNKDFL